MSQKEEKFPSYLKCKTRNVPIVKSCFIFLFFFLFLNVFNIMFDIFHNIIFFSAVIYNCC